MSGDGRGLLVLAGGQFVSTAGLTVVVPLLPLHLEELGALGPSRQLWTGIVLAAPAVTLALAAPLWGRAGDRWGRKPMVVRALLGLAAALVLMALARTPAQLLAARLLQGAFGGIAEAGAAFVTTASPAGARGPMLGRLHAATAAGALVGPLAGGPLADVVGLRAVLAAVAGLTAASALVGWVALREPAGTAPAAGDVVPTVGGERTSAPGRRPGACLLAGFCAQAGAYGLVTVFAPHVRSLIPDPTRAGAWVGGLQAVTWAGSTLAAPWWGVRHERRAVEANLGAALVVMAVAVALQAFVPSAWALLPLRVAQGWCAAAVVQGVLLAASRRVAPADQGSAIGGATSVLTAGQVAGALGGGLVTSVLIPPAAIVVFGAVVAVGAAGVLRAAAASSRYPVVVNP
ncbi:MAG: MFS transporter [Actinobacteria bacterium]|nr:MFS transporter [Actinomycetota bacterium]